jgi:aldose sugar dehydrogenase
VGKILRMNLNGRIPQDNPFPGSYIFAYGFRNSFGMEFDPKTDALWESENGPNCNDELNRVVPGGNYGWGAEWTCETPPDPPGNTNQSGADPQMPRTWYTPTTAPTGASFCSGCGLGETLEGNLFFAEFNTGNVRAVELGPMRRRVVSDRVVYRHKPGCLLTLEAGPDGALYMSDCSSIYKLVRP